METTRKYKENTPSKDGSRVWTRRLVLSPSFCSSEMPSPRSLEVQENDGEEVAQRPFSKSPRNPYIDESESVCGLLCGRMPGRINLWKMVKSRKLLQCTATVKMLQ